MTQRSRAQGRRSERYLARLLRARYHLEAAELESLFSLESFLQKTAETQQYCRISFVLLLAYPFRTHVHAFSQFGTYLARWTDRKTRRTGAHATSTYPALGTRIAHAQLFLTFAAVAPRTPPSRHGSDASCGAVSCRSHPSPQMKIGAVLPAPRMESARDEQTSSSSSWSAQPQLPREGQRRRVRRAASQAKPRRGEADER